MKRDRSRSSFNIHVKPDTLLTTRKVGVRIDHYAVSGILRGGSGGQARRNGCAAHGRSSQPAAGTATARRFEGNRQVTQPNVCIPSICRRSKSQTAATLGQSRSQYPLISAPGLSQWKSGGTSAPRLPQAEQVKRGSISDNRTSSRHRSPLIAM
jgi:hypothetical protein